MKFGLSALLVALTILSYSCKDDKSIDLAVAHEQESVAQIELSADVDTDVDSDAGEGGRGIQYTVGSSGKSIKLRLSDAVQRGFVVIKRVGAGSAVSAVTWEKVKGKNAVKAKGTITVPGGTGKLYMMGIIGGAYDERTKRISFKAPTGLVAPTKVGKDEVLDFDMPYASRWQEAEKVTVNKTAYVLLKKKAGSKEDTRMSFKPRGFVLGVSLSNKMAQALVQLNKFKLQSTQIRSAGYFDVDAEAVADRFMAWNYLDANVLQMSRFDYKADRIGSNQALPMRYTWAIAEERAVATPLTRVLVDIRLEEARQRYKANPTYLRTALNGTTKSTDSQIKFENGKNYLFVPEVRRPKMAIEYVADYNIGPIPGVFAETHSNSVTEANSTRLYTVNDAIAMTMPEGYILPTKDQMRGIMPPVNVRPGSPNPALRGVVYADATQASGNRLNPEQILIEEDTNVYNSDYYSFKYDNSGKRVAYGVRFKGNGDHLLSAWRYQYHETNTQAGGQGGILEVRARYLGPSYSGKVTIPTINNDAFWGIGTQKAADDVVRYFSLNGVVDPQGYKTKLFNNANYYEGYYWTKDKNYMEIMHMSTMLSASILDDKRYKMAIRPFLVE